MGAVSVDIQIPAINSYIVRKHGRPRSLTPEEDDILTDFANLIQQAIRDRWPVDTGTSRDQWEVSTIPSGGRVSILVENPMYYAEYVHDGLWSSLVPAVWNIVKPDLISTLKDAIDDTEESLKPKSRSIFNLFRAAS